jgi:hypothetical protein
MYMRTTHSIIFSSFLLVALPLIGCGSEDNADDAKRAWNAMTKPIDSAGGNSNALTLDQIDLSTEMDVDCSGGGSAHVVDNASVSGSDVSVNWDVDFNDCVEDGVTMNGKIGYKSDVLGTGDVKLEYIGEVDFTGAYEGSCNVDMHLSVSGSSVTASGEFCGFEADLIVDDDGVSGVTY